MTDGEPDTSTPAEQDRRPPFEPHRRSARVRPVSVHLLNLFLSMLAAIQGAILLIAAKRSDQIARLLAEHDYETDLHAFEHIEALQERLAGIAESNRQLLEQNAAILQRLVPTGTTPPP